MLNITQGWKPCSTHLGFEADLYIVDVIDICHVIATDFTDAHESNSWNSCQSVADFQFVENNAEGSHE